MLLANDKEHQVRSGLQEAIALFCKVGFKFDVELSIDGLLAVTLDQKEVFLLNIKEIIRPQNEKSMYLENSDKFVCSTDKTDANPVELRDEMSSLNNKKSLSKVKRKRKYLKKTVESTELYASSSAEKSDSDNSSWCQSIDSKYVENEEEGAEDLSLRDGEMEACSEPITDNSKLKVENDECSNTDQYLSSLLENGESFLDHVKQEPIVVGDDEPDEAAVPSTSSLPSIHQRLGFMSQYIGMPQVVAGLHSGIIAPSRAYHWPEHGLTPTATISRLATQMIIPPSNDSEQTYNSKKRSKMSLNIPSIRSNGSKSSPFLSPERNICANCGTGRTTTWRRTDDKQILCNACGCYFKLHKVHRPMSMVRHEIRSRCRLPKNLSYMKCTSKELQSSDSALNLKVSPPVKNFLNDQS